MKGILFKKEMFLATIEGRKTQTRRIIPEKDLSEDVIMKDESIKKYLCEARAKYKKGEVVYLKEPYILHKDLDGTKSSEIVGPTFIKYIYPDKNRAKWDILAPKWIDGKSRNKLFMPAKYARYFIKITNVRVERLKSISKDDALAEGVESLRPFAFKNYLTNDFALHLAKYSFQTLWISINGKESWDKNPWLFAYDFELTEKPG